MKRQQIILVSGGFILLIALFFLGNTIPPKKPAEVKENTPHVAKTIDTEKLLTHAKERLTPLQLQKITSLENSVSRGDVREQQLKIYRQLAMFWRDSIHLFEPYAYYLGEAAKLEKSEKSLTFAAHLFLANLENEDEPAMQNWLGTNAKVLFERALEINPANDSSKVGLGACYIFGNLSDNPMEGISKISEVAQRNPNDLFAQFMLGLGGMKSGQFDKAIDHFKIIVEKEPENMDALLHLAECYEAKDDNEEAIQRYKEARSKIANPKIQSAIDERVKTLQKK